MNVRIYTFLFLAVSCTPLAGMSGINVPDDIWDVLEQQRSEDCCHDAELPEKYLRSLSAHGFKFTFNWHLERNRLDCHNKILIKEFIRREENNLRTASWPILEKGLVKELLASKYSTERELAKKLIMWRKWSSKELFNFLRYPEDYYDFCEGNEKTYDYLAWVAFYELCKRVKSTGTTLCIGTLAAYCIYYTSNLGNSNS